MAAELERLVKEDALKGLTSAALAVHQNGVPVKYHNDFQKGRRLLWLMVQDAELKVVDGKPVIEWKPTWMNATRSVRWNAPPKSKPQ